MYYLKTGNVISKISYEHFVDAVHECMQCKADGVVLNDGSVAYIRLPHDTSSPSQLSPSHPFSDYAGDTDAQDSLEE